MKCAKNEKSIFSKGTLKILDRLPPLSFYELDFHNFFDGLIGSKTLSKYNGIPNYENETLEINNITIKYLKHFISQTPEQFNHVVRLRTDKNGEWFVPKATKFSKDIVIEPELYKSQTFKTTILVRTFRK